MRAFQLRKSLANPQHPYHKFGTGNLETLWTAPRQQGVNVRDELLRFHEQYYSANVMKLAVIGRESLDQLSEMVVSKFSAVPNKNVLPPKFEADTLVPSEMGTQVYFKPVKDLRTVQITIPIDDLQHHWRSKPGAFLGHFIGHEGSGSILSYLMRQGWCNYLSAGAQEGASGFEFYRIAMDLTEDGLAHYRDVVAVVFDYIDLLRESIEQNEGRLPYWAFEEQKQLSDIHFQFQSKRRAAGTVCNCSSYLQQGYPPEWTLSGGKIREFDMPAIISLLDQLRLERARIFLSAKSLPPVLTEGAEAVPAPDQKEPWYGTKYSLTPLPASWFDRNRPRTSHLSLPGPNPFVPQDLSVRRPVVRGAPRISPHKAAKPALLTNTSRTRLWFQPDERFGQPKADVFIQLKYSSSTSNAREAVLARLLTSVLLDDLTEYSYDAELAGLNYTVFPSNGSLRVTVSGYNDKQAVLLRTVLERLKTFTPNSDRLAAVADRLRRSWADFELSAPYQQVSYYPRWFCHDYNWLRPELLVELSSIKGEDVVRFRDEVLARLHVELYTHGNLEARDALALRDLVEKTISFDPIDEKERSAGPHSLLLPPQTDTIIRLTPSDPAEVNSAMVRYAQLHGATLDDLSTRAALGLLVSIARQPAFDELRTTQQLGYIVFVQSVFHDNSMGLSMTIQSEYEANSLRLCAEDFLRNKLAPLLRDMAPDTFVARRAAFAATMQESKSLSEESGRMWYAIVGNTYDFAHTHRLAEVVRTTPLSAVQDLFNKYVHPDSSERSTLVVQFESSHAKPLASCPTDGPVQDGIQTLEATSLEDAVKLHNTLAPSKSLLPIRPWGEFELQPDAVANL